METKTPSARSLLLPVGFALSCIVLTMLVFVAFGGVLPFTPTGYRLTVPLVSASNLVQGSDVEISGVKIGKVVEVQRDGKAVSITVELGSIPVPGDG